MSMRKTSYWRTQLGALGLDAEAAVTAEAKAEVVRMSRLELPALALPRRRPRSFPWKAPSLAGCLMAAALAFVILRPPGTVLSPKGGTHVAVYWERGGVVRPLGEGGPLAANDRLRAEVHSARAAVAYWGVLDAGGHLAVDAAFVAASAINVAPEAPAAFAQSLRLDAAPKDESLVVLVCEMSLAVPAAALTQSAAPQGCVRAPFLLR
jgi:hypothetical protein